MINKFKLLYITRKFPPMVGGMEKVSYALAQEFAKKVDLTLVSWGGSQYFLPYVFVIFLLKSLYLIPAKKITHVHIGDPILSPIGVLLKKLYGVKISITVHGLDIIFDFPGYQWLVPKCVSMHDKVICISEATKKECLKRGIPEQKCIVIPCGVYVRDFRIKTDRRALKKISGMDLDGKKVLVTVGRLVPRKGVYWFIKNVMKNLDREFVYLVIGEGPDYSRIEVLIKLLELEDRVKLLGKITDTDLKIVYNTADLFVMPNLRTNDSFEGFGIVALEAASAGLPVLASKVDGLQNVIINNKTGHLIDPGSSADWSSKLRRFFGRNKISGTKIRSIITQKFSWPKIAYKYLKVIR